MILKPLTGFAKIAELGGGWIILIKNIKVSKLETNQQNFKNIVYFYSLILGKWNSCGQD